MNNKIDEAKQIQTKISAVADQILMELGPQTDGDVYVAIAALAVAMCSLAKADGMSLAKVKEAIAIANRGIS